MSGPLARAVMMAAALAGTAQVGATKHRGSKPAGLTATVFARKKVRDKIAKRSRRVNRAK